MLGGKVWGPCGTKDDFSNAFFAVFLLKTPNNPRSQSGGRVRALGAENRVGRTDRQTDRQTDNKGVLTLRFLSGRKLSGIKGC